MNIPLSIVNIYTNKNKKGGFFYNLTFETSLGNVFSISTSALFFNTAELTVYLSDTHEHEVYSYSDGKKLSRPLAKKFIKMLSRGQFNEFKTAAERQKQGAEYSGQDEDDDLPF